MDQTELEQIRGYWQKKFPTVDVRLWSIDDQTKFFGQIISSEGNTMFKADTIGELIDHGESILRRHACLE